MSLEYVQNLFWEKHEDGGWPKLPSVMRAAFRSSHNESERVLAAKPTKKAENDKRIATDKIARVSANLPTSRAPSCWTVTPTFSRATNTTSTG